MAEVLERMRAESEACAATGKRRTIGWDGQENPHANAKGVRYGSDRDFPAYFDEDQLYDLRADPYEQTNLAADPARAKELADLKEQLRALLAPLPHTFGEFR